MYEATRLMVSNQADGLAMASSQADGLRTWESSSAGRVGQGSWGLVQGALTEGDRDTPP